MKKTAVIIYEQIEYLKSESIADLLIRVMVYYVTNEYCIITLD